MNELEATRAELQQLRDDTKRLLTVIAAALPLMPDCAHVALLLANNLGKDMHAGRSDWFGDVAAEMLMAASSSALKNWPEDEQLQELYQSLRPGTRQ